MLKALLVLGMLWWAWVGYAWLTSVVDPEEGAVRLVMFAAMAALLVAALCVPGAFGSEALLFACAYLVVRAAHILLFMIASRDDAALRSSVLGLAVSTAIGAGLLFVAAFTSGGVRVRLWGWRCCSTPAGRSCSAPHGWRLVPGHFAERHGAFVIIALGESIVALGVGADDGSTPASSPRRSSAVSRRGALVGLLRHHGDRRAPRLAKRRRDANATRSRATPTPTCTSR